MTTATQAINLDQAPLAVRRSLETAKQAMRREVYVTRVQEVVENPLSAILRAWRAAAVTIAADTYSSNAVTGAALASLTEAAKMAIDDLAIQFEEKLRAYRQNLVDPAPAIPAAEAMRIWQRCREQLEAGVPLATILSDADMMTVRVLSEELKAWHRMRNPLNVAGGDAVADGDLAAVEKRRYELFDDRQRARWDEAQRAEQGAEWTRTAFAHAKYFIDNTAGRDAFTGNRAPSLTLPTWAGSTVVIAA